MDGIRLEEIVEFPSKHKREKQMKMNKILVMAVMVLLLSGCNLVINTLEYKSTAKEFAETLINEDYDKSIDYMALEKVTDKTISTDKMKLGLSKFRELVVSHFGTELEYSFVKSEKKYSTIEGESTPPNSTLVFIELSNDEEIGILKYLFDDTSGKIVSIHLQDTKYPKPKMLIFWLFGLLAIGVLVLNIMAIRKIKKSSLSKKWRKYLAVIFLNAPSISYAAVSGVSISLLNFQFLLGISFSYMGYIGAVWTIGIPLGGLYWLIKLHKIKNEESEQAEEQVAVAEVVVDDNETLG